MNNQYQGERQPKQVYVTPRLVVQGYVGNLTKGPFSGVGDGASAQAPQP
jgi:hypothetical protein